MMIQFASSILLLSMWPTASLATEPLEMTDGTKDSWTWDSLEDSMDQAAKDGFEGVVLVTRDGKTVLHKAYGYANREQKIKNTTDTVFAIGSAPIGFTHAGILLLKDQKKLALDDEITKYFADVPKDKRTITIRHLMTGRSGLRDFHDLPIDKNPDHTWIDRDEAVKRIFSQKLLFEPGKGRRHSHSAWGLLAAIIEIASQETYQQFTTERLFKPAGMVDTGFFGEDVDENRIAVGYGEVSSNPNSPPHWGKTSWLVMGSGGQVSTINDMYRWQQAIYSGKILSPESTRQLIGSGEQVYLNGDMFGFAFAFSADPNQLFMVISNTVKFNESESNQRYERLWKQLQRLTSESAGVENKYSLGIVMEINDGVFIKETVSGGAGETGGLKVGDQLLSANGKPLDDDPLNVLSYSLQDGSDIDFEVMRNDKKINLSITPQKK